MLPILFCPYQTGHNLYMGQWVSLAPTTKQTCASKHSTNRIQVAYFHHKPNTLP